MGYKYLSMPHLQTWFSQTVVAIKVFHITLWTHYSDVIMSAMASQITSISIVYWTVCSGADQRTHQSSASLAFLREIHRWVINSPHKGPVTRKMFPLDNVIMNNLTMPSRELIEMHMTTTHHSRREEDNNKMRKYMLSLQSLILQTDIYASF